MDASADRYIIGLTGNIATGKSVVRQMLERLGAFVIDADELAHRAITRGEPGFEPILRTFGTWVLDERREIDRKRLGSVAFGHPDAMQELERIVHPLVRRAVEALVQDAGRQIIVIEAIKLLESPLRELCDVVWVTYAPEKVQLERLVHRRGMNRDEALARIRSQPSQRGKLAAADVGIRNAGSYENLWDRVLAEWNKISPPRQPEVEEALGVERGRPRDATAIADLLSGQRPADRAVSAAEVLEHFGEKAFLILKAGDRNVGLAAWQVENLVARTTDLYVEPSVDIAQGLAVLIAEMERSSRELQCEASLVFAGTTLAGLVEIWRELGYLQRAPHELGVRAWQDAARESMPENTSLFFKQLRTDRVLRPI